MKGEDTPKMDPTWRNAGQDAAKMVQDGPKMDQDSPKMAQDGPKMAQDGAKWCQDVLRCPEIGANMAAKQALMEPK